MRFAIARAECQSLDMRMDQLDLETYVVTLKYSPNVDILNAVVLLKRDVVCSGNFVQPDATTRSRSLWSELGP